MASGTSLTIKLICKICKQVDVSESNFLSHFDIRHRVSPSSCFTCGVEDCHVQFTSGKFCSKHLVEFHSVRAESQNSDQNVLKCPHCSCTAKLKVTLRVHRKRHHSDKPEVSDVAETEIPESLVSTEQEAFAEPPTKIICAEVDGGEAPLTVHDRIVLNDAIKEKYLHLYLTLRTKFHIPESTIQFMINSHYFLHKENTKIIKEELLAKLKGCGLLAENVENVISNILDNDTFLKVHAPDGPLRTPYMRMKAYTSGTFRYVSPKSHKLGMNADNIKRKYHTISVKESLEAMFEDDSTYEQFVESQSYGSKDGFIRDIYDGSLIQGHPAYCKGQKMIGLLFYEDDAELGDPLGSAKGKSKFTFVEFAVSNLQPWCRTREELYVSLIAHEKDVDYFGLPKLLEPLVEELKSLERDGISIRGENVKVILLMLLGDNLGTHIFTGFLENFSSAKYFCRFCEEPRDEWLKRWYGSVVEENEDSDDEDDDNDSDGDDDSSESECEREENENNVASFTNEYFQPSCPDSTVIPVRKVSYIKAPLRTPQSYEKCLAELNRKPAQDHIKGIAANCQFNQVNSFHCVGASPPCIGHDLFEGVVAHDIALAIKYFVKEWPDSVNIDFINRRITSMKLFGSDRGDKPAKVTAKMKKLRGSAVQNWNFLRFLIIIIGDRVNKYDKVWKMVLQLIDLTRILTSPAIPKASLPSLKEKIYSYIGMRVYCFPNVLLRPKHHYLEHYAEHIERFGCLMRVNTLPLNQSIGSSKIHLILRRIVSTIRRLSL